MICAIVSTDWGAVILLDWLAMFGPSKTMATSVESDCGTDNSWQVLVNSPVNWDSPFRLMSLQMMFAALARIMAYLFFRLVKLYHSWKFHACVAKMAQFFSPNWWTTPSHNYAPSLPLTPLRSRPLLQPQGLGERIRSPSRSKHSPAAKRILLHFRHKCTLWLLNGEQFPVFIVHSKKVFVIYL